MARRILLGEVGEQPTWTSAGTGVIVSTNGKSLSRTAADANNSARSVRPRTKGRLFVAFEAVALGADGFVVGVQTQAHPNTAYPGDNAAIPAGEAWGLHTGDGTANAFYYYNKSSTDLGAPIAAGNFALVAVDLDAGTIWLGVATSLTGGVTWFLSGDPATGSSPTDNTLITGGTGGRLGISTTGTLKNAVRRKFYLSGAPISQNSNLRMVADRESLVAICPAGFTPWGEFAYIGSADYASHPTDSPAARFYTGRIVEDTDPTYERAANVPQWQEPGRASPPIGGFDLDNSDGKLCDWRAYDLRDMPIRWRMGDPLAALSTFAEVGRSVIDDCEESVETLLRITHKDKLALLDRVLNDRTYPSGVPNAQLEGQPVPILFGGPHSWLPLVHVDPTNLEAHVHDDELGGVSALLDQGVAITFGTGYDVGTRTDGTGVRRLTNPNGRQVVVARGQVTLGADALGGVGEFTNWTGDNPDGWTTTETAPSVVTETTADQCRFNRSTASTVRIQTPGNVVTNGSLYYLEVVCVSYTSGTLVVSIVGGNTVCTITKAGTYRVGFVATATGALRLDATANPTDLRIDGLYLHPATLVERLPAWLAHLLVDRMGLEAADYDSSGATTMDSAKPYKLGRYIGQQPLRAVDLLRETFDSYTGWFYVDRLDVLKFGYLVVPTTGASVQTFTDVELYGDVLIRPDRAEALSDRVAGQRNYAVHEESEIAGSLYTTGAGRILAAQLKEQWQAIRRSATPLAAYYVNARTAEPLPTLLTDAAQVQTEATNVGTLWNVGRVFYRFQAFVEGGAGYLLEPGQVVTLQSDSRPDLVTGVPVVLTMIRSRFLTDLVEFEGWGAPPSPTLAVVDE